MLVLVACEFASLLVPGTMLHCISARACRRIWQMRQSVPSSELKCKLSTRPESPAVTECVGMDIGGSLAKVVVFEPNANSSELVHRIAERMKSGKHPGYEANLTFEADDGVYSFLKFETRWMVDFLEVLKSLEFPPISLSATGGGAFKVTDSVLRLLVGAKFTKLVHLQFSPAFQRTIGATIDPCDEMRSLVRGFRFCFEVRSL